MLILLWGLATENPLRLVYEELQRVNARTRLVDQREVLATEVNLSVGSDVSGSVVTRDQKIDLGEVTAAYIRPYDSRLLPVVSRAGPESREWKHALMLDDTLSSWAEVTPSLVVNRLGDMSVNGSKPYQLELIRKLGFNTPETLVTTVPIEAQAFWERHGIVIYKSVSSLRSIVSRLQPEHVGRLADVTFCPTQFQQYIKGCDYRVHVVGSEVFACEVSTDATDYRYPNGNPVRIRSCSLPQDVEDRCRLLAARMNLPVAGIDLRRSPDGEWYCFEVNPSPAFSYYQSESGQPISSAITRLLINGSSCEPALPGCLYNYPEAGARSNAF